MQEVEAADRVKVEEPIEREFVPVEAIRLWSKELDHHIDSTRERGEDPKLLVKATRRRKTMQPEVEAVFLGDRHLERRSYSQKPPRSWLTFGGIIMSPEQAKQLGWSLIHMAEAAMAGGSLKPQFCDLGAFDEGEMIQEFKSLFIQRIDCFAEQTEGGTYVKVAQPITDDLIRDHLSGWRTIATYPAFGSKTRAVIFDIDDPSPKKARAIADVLDRSPLSKSYLIEFSGRKGWHVWILFKSPIPLDVARDLGEEVAKKAGVECEVFPKQRFIERFGNPIKLPLGVHRVSGKRSYFVNPMTWTEKADWWTIQPYEMSDQELKELSAKRGEHAVTKDVISVRPFKGRHPVCIRKLLEGVDLGKRDETAIRLAHYFHIVRGFSEEKALALLLRWNERNHPPIGEAANDPRDLERYFTAKIHASENKTTRFGCESLRRLSLCPGKENCEFFKRMRRNKKWSITISG